MLARLAVPNVAAVAATTAVTFADVYFVGQIGTTALASLAIVFPFQNINGDDVQRCDRWRCRLLDCQGSWR
ncbi:MAG: hypothetical protein CM1200mP39_00230 [Dehalococcoidia bacterium]|nr:MAG: hypothetical protein CM1200mP39_00230 [Dehalococcoidia bacterium]